MSSTSLVVGSTGLIGKKLIFELAKKNSEVIAITRRSISNLPENVGLLDINFDDLSFKIEKDAKFKPALLTDDIKKLDGVKVKLRGYILPSTLFKETNIYQFVLVRDNQECCFGPGAALFDCVIVEMVPGNTTDFVTRPVTVEGKFKIDTEKYKYPNGVGPRGASHFAIFKIDGVKVK